MHRLDYGKAHASFFFLTLSHDRKGIPVDKKKLINKVANIMGGCHFKTHFKHLFIKCELQTFITKKKKNATTNHGFRQD